MLFFFNQLKYLNIELDLVTYSILIKCLCKNQLIDTALQLFEVLKYNYVPDGML